MQVRTGIDVRMKVFDVLFNIFRHFA